MVLELGLVLLELIARAATLPSVVEDGIGGRGRCKSKRVLPRPADGSLVHIGIAAPAKL